MDTSALPSWLQAGGVVAFAMAVWLQMRDDRRERAVAQAQATAVLAEMRDAVTLLAAHMGVTLHRNRTPVRGVPITTEGGK